jgi:hypothetical protein
MRGIRRILVAAGIVVFLMNPSPGALALADDLETDAWLPFTHFLLGDRASAGYSADFARSGTRSYHVEIHGYSILDFGSAYGYAVYATRGAPITELRVSILYDHLEDLSPSRWDAYAAGVELDLLDMDSRKIGEVRYITAYQASRTLSLCGPTKADFVLQRPSTLGVWADVGRNPLTDFPSAPWHAAEFVRISIGFLCTSGLKGASYSMYFDDFVLDTGAGDSDGDGLRDIDEEARLYAVSVDSGSDPTGIPSAGTATIEIEAPPVAGILEWAGIELEIEHPRPEDLSVELVSSTDATSFSQLLWDPGFGARGVAILEPAFGAAVRGTLEVRGMAWRPDPIAHLYVDDTLVGSTRGGPDGNFTIPWPSDAWVEGTHLLRVTAHALDGDEIVTQASVETPVVVDRTSPVLTLIRPANRERVRGLAVVEAGAQDDRDLAAVIFSVDGVAVDTRGEEPFTFFYDTVGLVPGPHTFGVRARDRAGNEVSKEVDVRVGVSAEGVPLPCWPACNLDSGSTSGDLPPTSMDPTPTTVPLGSGGRLEVSEGFRVPWVPRVLRSHSGVSLLLDAARDRNLRESDGLVGSSLEPADFLDVRRWQIIIRDHGAGEPGMVESARLLLASRSSPALADTDSDGLEDGFERASLGTVPVLPDLDGDFLLDGDESITREMTFVIDGSQVRRTVRSDPFDFDTDDDGLPDGLELLPGDGRSPTDPADPDTDQDTLSDSVERFVHGSDPTMTDTDGDTLSDSLEVTPRALELEIDGVIESRSIVTSPASEDTDGDGLRDGEEWNGRSLYGFLTDPTDVDTDREGLSDFDEVIGLNRRPTNPLTSDTDSDGLVDSLDLSPTELWEFRWRGTFEPGTVRFTQRFRVLGVHGLSAGIWTYDLLDDACVFLSDHTAEATRSSDESPTNVLATMNHVLVEGGEQNFTAVGAEDLGEDSWGVASSVYGACDFFNPRQYRIDYLYDSHSYSVDFLNTGEVALRDDSGDLFYHAALDVPIRLSKPQSIVLQFSIESGADHGSEVVVPAVVYSLARGSDFLSTQPFYRNLAVGAALDDHAYEFHLRIPQEVATGENVRMVGDVPTATLLLMPMWLESTPSGVARSALNATRLTMAATISRVQESAELVIGRLSTDMESLEEALPASATAFATGYYGFGPYSVYVYHMGGLFDSAAPEAADAIYFVGESPEQIAAFQSTIVWAPDGAWVQESEDSFGLLIGVFKILRRGISLTSQITSAMIIPLLSMPGTMEQMSFGRSAFVITKLTDIETGQPYYVIGATAVETVKVRVPHPEIPGVTLTEVRTIERELRGEIVDDLDDSRLLTGVKYSQLKVALRGAAIGATLVIFGSQAVLAFRDGDVVKGAFYSAAGATAVFGIVKADVPLLKRAFESTRVLGGRSVKLGSAAGIAVAGLLASYELFLAGQASSPVEQLSHYEGAGAISVDALVTAVPLYGAAAMLGWQLGLVVAVGLQSIVGVLPDPLAVKIVSTPGSTVVFLFEYIFATDIPTDIANDALVQLLNILADTARYLNSLIPPEPTLLLVP